MSVHGPHRDREVSQVDREVSQVDRAGGLSYDV